MVIELPQEQDSSRSAQLETQSRLASDAYQPSTRAPLSSDSARTNALSDTQANALLNASLNQDIFQSRMIVQPDNTRVASPAVTEAQINANTGPRTERDLSHDPDQKLKEASIWLRDNMGRLDVGKDKSLDRGEIEIARVMGDLSEEELEMLDTLESNFDTLKNAHADTVSKRGIKEIGIQWGGKEKDAITLGDVNKKIVEIDRELESKEQARDLLQGRPPLFSELDKASNGKMDGQIGKGDLVKFMQNYHSRKNDANPGAYTQENFELVNKMYFEWDNPMSSTGRMRGVMNPKDALDSFNHPGGHPERYAFITPESLAKALEMPPPQGANRLAKLADLYRKTR